MSEPSPVIEGVFAVHKPIAVTSAQVLRDLQKYLNPSKTFAPWIQAEQSRREAESGNQYRKRSRRSRQPVQVKLGHGGTLDPLATGVLVVGVGSGTKKLQNFIDCTKTYETVVVFGAASDTYDTEGKVVKRAPYQHVTKDLVQEALKKFRGDIMQRPPIYSALRVQGKRLYEYAREGKEVPIEIQERPVTVTELECLEWLEPGTHEYNWPEQEAEEQEKKVVDKLLHPSQQIDQEQPTSENNEDLDTSDLKRKREEVDEASAKKTRLEESTEATEQTSAAAAANDKVSDEADTAQKKQPCPAPAARLRMTVSSGFYVRSLCHDLGAAVGSLGLMAALERSRQGEFELKKNVLEYDDLEKGEDVWAPKLTDLLAQWHEDHPEGQAGAPRITAKRTSSDVLSRRARNSSSPE